MSGSVRREKGIQVADSENSFRLEGGCSLIVGPIDRDGSLMSMIGGAMLFEEPM